MNDKVLSGIKVLDFTVALAGPYSTMMLAAMGADVIKIENSVMAPPSFGARPGRPNDNAEGIGLFFANCNAGKRAVTINMKTDEGKEIFTRMLKEADVLVENNRPGVLPRMGFDYESCKAINPGIIYASGSGLGQTGLYWRYPGYDIIGQAMGGGMSVTGFPGDHPTNGAPSFSDCSVSVNLANAIVAALVNRQETGLGSYIETSLVDCIVTDQEYQMPYAIFEKTPGQTGNRYDRIAGPRDGYYASDGYFVIECTTQAEFEALCRVINREDLIVDERFASPRARYESARQDDPLKAIISDWAKERTIAEAVAQLQQADVPSFPIHDFRDIYESEHIHGAREMFTEVPTSNGKSMIVTGMPIKMSTYKTSIDKAVSFFGEDNDAVFGGLGYSKEELEELRAKGVIH